MPDILSTQVPNGTAAPVWSSRNPGVSSLLFINKDLNNTVYMGSSSNITPTSPNVVPIAPNGTFSGDANANWYVTGATAGIAPLVTVPNGQAYFLGITQGLGNLAIPQIQSPNYVPGVSGWAIFKNGNVEFNNGVFRGNIVSGALYIYTGTPELGNPPVLWMSNATEDPYGNGLVTQGIVTANGSNWTSLNAGQVNFGNNGYINGDSDYMTFGGAPLDILSAIWSVLLAIQPGTTLTEETWHTVGGAAYGSGWEGSGSGVNGVVYYYDPTGFVTAYLDVKTSDATPGTTIVTVPEAYVPAQDIACEPIAPPSGGSAYPVVVFTSGALVVSGIPNTSGVRYAGKITWPLNAV